MSQFFRFLQRVLVEPTIIIGALVAIGYMFDKKSSVKVITGAISAMVGLEMLLFGGTQFINTFRPIVTAVSEVHGIQGFLMDPYSMRASTQVALGEHIGFVGYVFVLAFFINLGLVFLGKYTKAKGIFLTGNTGVAHSQAILWLVAFWFKMPWLPTIIVSAVLLAIYWAIGTTLAIKPVAKITNNGGFTIGHNQTFGIWFFSKFAHKFGKPEDDAENLKLPGILSIFNHNVTAVAVIMTIFTGGFLLSIGIDNMQKMAGNQHWALYVFNIGIRFSMFMVILLTGVRMMVGEISASFKGIQEKLIPGAVPAIDVAALLPFSPNAATLGFIFCTLGTIFSMAILLISGSPILVLPGFVPLFFAGGPIGVVGNKFGGYKAAMICPFILGMIQSFGSIWAIKLSGIPDGMGWTGMFDFATIWPAVTQIMAWIAKLLGIH